MDPRVKAIRNDPNVGRDSCSVVDECMTDDELIADLDADDADTVGKALSWAYGLEGLHREKACDARWGEDDDPQLVALEEWKTIVEHSGVEPSF